jgi:hypothetical protein
MKKLIGYLTIMLLIITVNITIITRKPVYASMSCKGYEWRWCSLKSSYLIFCTCSGGPTCWAAWQEICE